MMPNEMKIFLINVPIFDIIKKSPKQPQSSTGLAIIIYALKGSIMAIIAVPIHTAVRL